MPEPWKDDTLTLIALGMLAFILADLTHEALGHGLMTLAVGGTPVVLTTTYLTSSGQPSRWIPAAGGLANLVAGLLSLGVLRLLKQPASRLRYFLILALAFNLLFATAYPAYSGLALFGDWAAVISGLSPAWLWRVLLVALSGFLYYLSLRLIAVEIAPFCGSNTSRALQRLRRITLIPFAAALAVAALAALFNPQEWTNIFTAAIPSAAAAFGITQLDHFPETHRSSAWAVGPITRSAGWIVAAVFVAALFVGVLGPGISSAPLTAPRAIAATPSTK